MIENKNNINKFARSHRQIFFNLTISNYFYEMNFDQRVSFIGNEPFAPKKSDFKFIQKLPYKNRYFNGTNLLDKKEC